MIDTDKPHFRTALQRLALLYNRDLNTDRIGQYWENLRDLSVERVVAACEAIGRQAGEGQLRFFPLPGTIRANQPPLQQNLTSSCPHCNGIRWVKAEPDMSKVRRIFGEDATVASAQPTVRRCACIQVA